MHSRPSVLRKWPPGGSLSGEQLAVVVNLVLLVLRFSSDADLTNLGFTLMGTVLVSSRDVGSDSPDRDFGDDGRRIGGGGVAVCNTVARDC